MHAPTTLAGCGSPARRIWSSSATTVRSAGEMDDASSARKNSALLRSGKCSDEGTGGVRLRPSRCTISLRAGRV